MGASGQQHLHNVICNIASQCAIVCTVRQNAGHNVIHKMARTSCGCTLHTAQVVDATHCAMLPGDKQNEWVYFV